MKSIGGVAVFLACLTPVWAGEWGNLAGIRAGQGVEVTRKSGETARGEFVRFDEGTVSVRVKGQDTAIARAEVRRVRLTGKGRKAMWIGAAIGAGGGLGIGAAAADRIANESGGDFNGLKPAITGAMAGVGAVIGMLVGSLVGGRHATVYEGS